MGILYRIAFCLALCVGPLAASATCRDDRISLRGDFGSVDFNIEVMRTPQELALGLMHRESMPRMSGMLFVYPREKHVAFWMRNTLIPLDMVFIDAVGRVVNVHENAIPLDETPIPSGVPAQFVLEINAGTAAALGLREGVEIRHPALEQNNPVWPCN